MGSIGKISELGLPEGQAIRKIAAEPILKTKGCGFRKHRIIDFEFTLIIGLAKKNTGAVIENAGSMESVKTIIAPPDLHEFIKASHIVISSGRTTAYECIASGRPIWIIPQIEFEAEVGKILKSKGALLGLGLDTLKFGLIDKLPGIKSNPKLLKPVIETGRKLIDGKGMIRIADKIIEAMLAIDKSKPQSD